MNSDYDTIYEQFEKNFKEEANSFIAESNIKNALRTEKILFDNAKKYDIPINKIVGNSIVRYTKDVLRHCQPLFFIYYIISVLSEFFYYLLIWSVIKCIYFYFTGLDKTFSRQISFSVSIVFFAVIIIYNVVTKSYARNLLFKCSQKDIPNVKSKINIFNIVCCFISASIVIISTLFIYLNPRRVPVVSYSLFEIFIFTVAILSLSGVHNVIYSSHLIPFITTGYLYILHKYSKANSAILHYKELSLENFLILRHITISEYKENIDLQTEFNKWLHQKIITFRVYGALAFFITVILTVVCLKQLIKIGLSIELIIFTVIAFVITIFILLEITSCNCILKGQLNTPHS